MPSRWVCARTNQGGSRPSSDGPGEAGAGHPGGWTRMQTVSHRRVGRVCHAPCHAGALGMCHAPVWFCPPLPSPQHSQEEGLFVLPSPWTSLVPGGWPPLPRRRAHALHRGTAPGLRGPGTERPHCLTAALPRAGTVML